MTEVSVEDRYDREMLTIIASRALLRSRMIAENAARGRFPTHEKCETASEFDFKELRQRIHRRNKWQEREIKHLQKQHGE
jgi:pyruvate/2-oxoglutarate dehydrogenase complex dihydrolipoamide dehydrogenase (E3) component